MTLKKLNIIALYFRFGNQLLFSLFLAVEMAIARSFKDKSITITSSDKYYYGSVTSDRLNIVSTLGLTLVCTTTIAYIGEALFSLELFNSIGAFSRLAVMFVVSALYAKGSIFVLKDLNYLKSKQ